MVVEACYSYGVLFKWISSGTFSDQCDRFIQFCKILFSEKRLGAQNGAFNKMT